MLNIPESEFVGFIAESVLYGLYLILFSISTRQLCNRPHFREVNKVVLTVTCALLIFVTVHWGVSIKRLYVAFIEKGSLPLGTLLYLIQISYPLFIAKLAAYGLTSMLMNVLLVWRLFVIWDHRLWIIILPAAACAAQFVAFCLQLYYTSKSTFTTVGHGSHSFTWTMAFFSLEFSICFTTTGLIVYRIIHNSKILTRSGMRNILLPAVHIILESALLYSIMSAIVFAFYASNRTGETFLMLDIIPPIIGVNYSLLLILLHNRAGKSFRRSSSGVGGASGPRSGSGSGGGGGRGGHDQALPLRVTVSQQTVDDAERGSSGTIRFKPMGIDDGLEHPKLPEIVYAQ